MKQKSHLFMLAFLMFAWTLKAGESYWPKEIRTAQGTITLYQLQPESLDGNNLCGRAALSLKVKGKNEPVFGAFWFMAQMFTDREERMITLESIRIDKIKFPDDLPLKDVENIQSLLEEEIPTLSLVFPLDELLATIEENNSAKSGAEGLANDAPEILFRNNPAVLISIDGDPRVEDIEGSAMQQVINTPYFIIHDPRMKEYWLYGDGMWFVTSDAIRGKWAYEAKPPRSIEELIQDTDDYNRLVSERIIPEIIVRTHAAELIVMEGEPMFTPIESTRLLYIKNTTSDVFLDINSQSYYILLSGRWYLASSLTGPWRYIAADRLPVDFKNIPEGSEKDKVLASVAGTNAAKEAVLDAAIPQTATVKRNEARLDVAYDGNPKFISIPGTQVSYAENSANTVLYIKSRYYACENAVWFESDRATGPWEVCVHVPDDVRDIPPSAPVYHVKYVYVYDYTPDVVYVGYTPGYTGCYVYGPTVVYGTGFHYHSWYGTRYYARPVTYGYHMHYNPYNGWSIGYSSTYWSPYNWFSYSYTHPAYHYHNYGGYWGPPAYRPPYHHHYHHYYGPRPVPYTAYKAPRAVETPQNIYYNHRSGVESSRRSVSASASQRTPVDAGSATSGKTSSGNAGTTSTRPSTSTRPVSAQPDAPSSTRPTSAQPSTRTSTSSRPASTSASGSARRTSTNNNVYTDQQGNVYRRTNQEWQKREDNSWKPATQPSARPSSSDTRQAAPSTTRQSQPSTARPDLEQQNYSRERGAQRSTNAQVTKPSASSGLPAPAKTGSRSSSTEKSSSRTATPEKR
jgi:hypothetical protein